MHEALGARTDSWDQSCGGTGQSNEHVGEMWGDRVELYGVLLRDRACGPHALLARGEH